MKPSGKGAVNFPVKSFSFCVEGAIFLAHWKGQKFLFLPQNFTGFLSNSERDTKIKEIKLIEGIWGWLNSTTLKGTGKWINWGDGFYLRDSAESRKEDQRLIHSFIIKPPLSPDGIWGTVWELSVQIVHLRSLQAGLSPSVQLQDRDRGQLKDAWEFGAAPSLAQAHLWGHQRRQTLLHLPLNYCFPLLGPAPLCKIVP